MGGRHTNAPAGAEAPLRIGPHTCSPRQGMLFVDHARNGRSGHLGHALVEYAPGKILAFYANCSDHPGLNTHGDEWRGHNGDGWMAYRRSEDGGRTWGAPTVLDYSKRVYDESNGEALLISSSLRLSCKPVIPSPLLNSHDVHEKTTASPSVPG